MNCRFDCSSLFLASMVTLATFSSAARAEEFRLEKSYVLRAAASVHLRSEAGEVVVRGTDGASAELTIHSSRDDFAELYDIRIDDRSPDRLEVIVEKKSHGPFDWIGDAFGGGAEIELAVPRTVSVEVKGSGGKLAISDLDGRVRAESSGGSLRATDLGSSAILMSSGGGLVAERIRGDVEIQSSGGSVKTRQIGGATVLRSSGGSVEATDIGGDLDAESSGGGVRIAEAHGAVVAESSGGPVKVGFAAGNSRGGRLQSSGGGLEVTLDGSSSVTIDAVASGGGVRCDLPLTARGKLRRGLLQGDLNGGGEVLRLRSSGGGITIAER